MLEYNWKIKTQKILSFSIIKKLTSIVTLKCLIYTEKKAVVKASTMNQYHNKYFKWLTYWK